MVATDPAVLPWSRQTLAGAPAPNIARTGDRSAAQAQQALNAPNAKAETDDSGFKPFGKDGFSFFDLVDVINPLQHIPLIGTVYRELTGDTLDPLPRIAGSTLFFGPVGAAFSGANVVIEEMSGQDMGEHIMTALGVGGESVRTAAATAPAVPDHGVSVIAKKPAAAGTDAEIAALPGTPAGDMDPVSAWARGEIAYRRALADEHQLAVAPPAPEAPAPARIQTAVKSPAQAAAPLSWANNPLIDPAAVPAPPAKAASAQAARATQAGAAPDLSSFVKALGAEQPVSQAKAVSHSRRAARAYGRNGATVASRAEPAVAARGAVPASGAIGTPAAGGGWFATNMMHSLEQYQRQQTLADGEQKKRLDQAVN